MRSSGSLNRLPEDCLSTILSLTSPLDVCRSSLVSLAFRSAMKSDIIWERFLPSDYLDTLSRLVTPFHFSSKKDLFLRLCNPILLDGGTMSFKLLKSSGRKSYILSARALSITWSNHPVYWCWISMAESRFSEVAVLRTTSWLEIEGKIKTGMLTTNTTYGAYLLMKISDNAYGLDTVAAEMAVEVGDQVSACKKTQIIMESIKGDREDGWMEIELGEFVNGDDDDQEVKISLKEVKGYQLKGGLAIEGIEVRPKEQKVARDDISTKLCLIIRISCMISC